MATYWIWDCGHETVNAPWGKGENQRTSGLCRECRGARVGQTIQFVRHGKPPASGDSRNHREGVSEGGVSVYEVVNGAPQYVGWHFGISERPAYTGQGRIVGWGSDGEPLVEIISIRRAKKFDK